MENVKDEVCSIKIEVCATILEGETKEKFLPFAAHESDAAFDIMADVKGGIEVMPFETILVSAGFKIEIPKGYEAQIRPRSGNALKKHLQVANSPGTIDSGYRGVVGVIVYNAGNTPFTISRGDKIAQMVINKLPIVRMTMVDSVNPDSDRGQAGFGSTGC